MTIERQKEKERVEQMIRSLGTDPLQVASLGNAENYYFFGEENCGAIFYTLAGRRALSLGDPVCEEKDMNRLISGYLDFCDRKEYRCIFNSVSQSVAGVLRAKGLLVAKYGEEGILDMEEYSLSGGKKGALRRNVAKLDRNGCTSQEYCARDYRDESLEKEIFKLRQDWLDEKKLKLTYSVGDLQFESPCGRRYFLTRDQDGRLLTVVSFLPYRQGEGCCVDVMYRKPGGPTGAMEHAIISAMRQFREEGAKEISLNIAPLAGIDPRDPEASGVEKMMHAIFCNMDYGYDFKGLYRFKEKFVPSVWKPRFLAYDHRISTVMLVTSIADVKGVVDMGLFLRYKRFFLSYVLTPRKYQNN